MSDWLTPRPESGCPLGLGNINGYTNRKCRCAACADAWAAYMVAYMARKPEQREARRARSRRLYRARRKAAAS